MALKKFDNKTEMLFGKKNYMFMLIGIVVIILGFVLMAGGKNPTDAWDDSTIYSARRITIAPMIVLIGFIIEIFAIMIRPTSDQEAVKDK